MRATEERIHVFPDEYLPGNVALRFQRPGRTATALYWAIVLLIVASLIIASLVRVDRIVIARGALATTIAATSIRPLQTTVTKQILVYPGERVRAGQLLVRFDKSLDQSAFDTLAAKAQSLDRELRRLRAEIKAGPTGFATDAEYGSQAALLADRSSVRKARLLNYGSQVASSRNSMRAALVARDVDRETLRIETSKYAILNDLYSKGYYPRLQLLQAYESILQSRAAFARDAAGAVAARDAETQVAEQAQEFASQEHAEAVTQYVAELRDQGDTLGELKKEAHLLALSDVRAPFDASIIDVAPENGTAVASAQPLVTLVPLNAPLQAEVFADNKDVSYLALGLRARIKLDAYPFERHGWIDGHVKIIAHDSSGGSSEDATETKSDDPKASNASRYRIILALDKIRFRDVTKPELLPGMVVESDVIVGQQSVLSYLLEPLVHHFGDAFSEPEK